jgi:hypothetical protein
MWGGDGVIVDQMHHATVAGLAMFQLADVIMGLLLVFAELHKFFFAESRLGLFSAKDNLALSKDSSATKLHQIIGIPLLGFQT